uniref:L1 transposable element RRM domain-containing protein n=1 Tax=Labrus bergylta TaxID=56723 RepID=A0A3Q3EHW0_9LABR
FSRLNQALHHHYIPTRAVTKYPNSKPWITFHIKLSLKEVAVDHLWFPYDFTGCIDHSCQTGSKAKKLHTANTEASMEDSDSTLCEDNVANAIAQNVTEKISALMELKFAELKSSLDKLSTRIGDNTKRIMETECRISDGEDRTASLENKLAELERRVKTLTDRAEDSENRSRRDNIRVIGLKEGAEGRQAVKFFGMWLPDTLGLETKRGTIKIDRAHRALGPPKKDYNRPVIIKLHNFGDKQKILAAVREKGELIFQVTRIHIRQDLSTQVREARRQFNGTCERLIGRGIRFQMPLLQETHLSDAEHIKLRRGWVGQVFYTSHNSKSRGVAIILHRSLPFTLDRTING